MSINFSLNGRSALVTGATHGLGMAMAMGLGKAGATVVINGHSSDEKIANAVKAYEAEGIKAHGYKFDVTDEAAVAEAISLIEAEVGPVDILVNNAGIIKRVPMLDMPVEDWEQVIKTDLTSVFIMSKAVVPGMMERGWGRVVSSVDA